MCPDPLDKAVEAPKRVTLHVCECGAVPTTSPWRCSRGHEHRLRPVEYVLPPGASAPASPEQVEARYEAEVEGYQRGREEALREVEEALREYAVRLMKQSDPAHIAVENATTYALDRFRAGGEGG